MGWNGGIFGRGGCLVGGWYERGFFVVVVIIVDVRRVLIMCVRCCVEYECFFVVFFWFDKVRFLFFF